MKKKLKKYPNGGEPTITPFDSTGYYNTLNKYQNFDYTKVPTDVSKYVASTANNMKAYQEKLNNALYSKYKLKPGSQITNQYLTPEESDKALNGQYKSYMDNFKAYQAYRDKTTGLPSRNVEGTADSNPEIYGQRHVNLFQPYTPTITNVQTHKYGGRQLPKYESGGYNPADPNRPLIPDSNSGVYSNGYTGQTYGVPSNPEYSQPTDNRNLGDKATGSMGWMAYAQAAKGIAKGVVQRDENGKPISNIGAAIDQMSEESHKTAMNEAQQGDYKGALREITGFGKVSRTISNLMGKGQETEGFWGKVNKANDNQYYSQDQYNSQYRMGGKMCYPDGGEFPNAEVEKQEVMQSPDGSTMQVDGPSHENGGVPVNIPKGTKIYSDRLKMPGTKKTFAKLAEKYKDGKEKKILEDNLSDKTSKATANLIASMKQKKLDELFNAQESLKQEKVIKYAKRMGIDTNKFSMGGLKKYAGVPPYETSGRFIPEGWESTSYQNGLQPMTVPLDPEMKRFNDLSESSSMINEYKDSNPELYDNKLPLEKPDTEKDYSGLKNGAGLVANVLGQNLGNIYDLAQTRFGKKYDKENSGQITPNLLDSKEALRDADIQASVTRNSLKDLTNGNVGAYLSNLTGAQTANTLNKAKIREQYQNLNTDILNKALYHNQATKAQDKANEQANKARSEDITRNAISGIGTNTAAAIKDYNLGKRDRESLEIISRAYPNYEYDSKRRIWKHKTTGKKLELENKG